MDVSMVFAVVADAQALVLAHLCFNTLLLVFVPFAGKLEAPMRRMVPVALARSQKELRFSEAGWAELLEAYERMNANMTLAFDLLISEDVEEAGQLFLEKTISVNRKVAVKNTILPGCVTATRPALPAAANTLKPLLPFAISTA